MTSRLAIILLLAAAFAMGWYTRNPAPEQKALQEKAVQELLVETRTETIKKDYGLEEQDDLPREDLHAR